MLCLLSQDSTIGCFEPFLINVLKTTNLHQYTCSKANTVSFVLLSCLKFSCYTVNSFNCMIIFHMLLGSGRRVSKDRSGLIADYLPNCINAKIVQLPALTVFPY